MNEKMMQAIFGKYLKGNPPKKSEIYELKYTSDKRIPFDRIETHQLEALLAAKKSSLYHKITDQPIFPGMQTRFHHKKPFDCFCFVGIDAYIVVWFYKPRQRKVFIKIEVEDFLKMKSESARKSFTEDEAMQFSSETIKI